MQKTGKAKKKSLKDRLKNPKFLVAVAGVAYQAANYISKKYAGQELDLGQFQMIVDLASYVAIGVGVYSTFE